MDYDMNVRNSQMDQFTQEVLLNLISELKQRINSLEKDVSQLKINVSQLMNRDYPNYSETEIASICEEAHRIERSLNQK